MTHMESHETQITFPFSLKLQKYKIVETNTKQEKNYFYQSIEFSLHQNKTKQKDLRKKKQNYESNHKHHFASYLGSKIR